MEGDLCERWEYRFRANGTPRNLRERIGDWLRILAQRIDGRSSFGIAIETTPALDAGMRTVCIKRGFDAMKLALEIEAKAEAEEKIFRRIHPRLFRGEEIDRLR